MVMCLLHGVIVDWDLGEEMGARDEGLRGPCSKGKSGASFSGKVHT